MKSALVLVSTLALFAGGASAATIDTHTVVLDGTSNLLSWVAPQDHAYAHVAALSANFIRSAMVGPIDPANGLPVIYTHSEYNSTNFTGSGWPNNPAGKHAMLADSMMLYYAYSGDSNVLAAVQSLLDFQLRQFPADLEHPLGGTTAATYNWASVPWSCGNAGDTNYGTDGYSDGRFTVEPDKVGELGFHGYLRFYEITGKTNYLNAAIACADALASHVRNGSATNSPWPFKVNAVTGQLCPTPEDYCAHTVAPIRLFDELIRLGLGNTNAYVIARAMAWNWLMTYPMTNNIWANYFEDDSPQANNLWNENQYDPGQTARYLLEHPELDPNWQAHAASLINYIETVFGYTDSGEQGAQYGQVLVSEQKIYQFKMGSHTSRFAAINALYAERTGDAVAKNKAFRSLNWCTYQCRTNGSVMEGPKEAIQNPPFWFTDGHGDYIRHFMIAMGAFPEWAPADENHLLRSSSVVKSVTYTNTAISYTTFDNAATEVFRLASVPVTVLAGGAALPQLTTLTNQGWTYDASSGVLRVRHDTANQVQVLLDTSNLPPSISLTAPNSGATFAVPVDIVITANATGLAGAVTNVSFYAGTNLLGSDLSVPYGFTWTNVPAGNYTLMAMAFDDTGRSNTSTSVSITVIDTNNLPPSVSLTTPANGASFTAPALITLSASAIGLSGTVTNVLFFAGTNPVGADTTSPYTFTWPNVPIGSYTLTAAAFDDHGHSNNSTPVAITVIAPGGMATLGNTNEGTTTDYITDNSGAYINACRFQATANATVTQMRAKVGAIAGRYQCAIYSDNSGNANALLANTVMLTNVTTGWQTFLLTSSLAITNGNYYWLAIWSDDVNARVSADSSGTVRFAAYPFTSNWPNPINLTGGGGFTYCIYATGPAPTAFQQWKSNYGLAANTSNTSDADGDGIPLLLEYTYGLNPLTNSTAGSPAGKLQSNYLTLTYQKIKAATDITCTVEVSSNVTGPWLSGSNDVNQLWQVLDGLTTQTITARDKTAVPNATSRLMRLKVTQP